MNVGPMGDGTLRLMDRAIYDLMGQWVSINGEAIYAPYPSGIEVENKEDDFILVKDNTYYLFCDKLPMSADPNVALKVQNADRFQDVFKLDKKIKKITWIDNGEAVEIRRLQSQDRACPPASIEEKRHKKHDRSCPIRSPVNKPVRANAPSHRRAVPRHSEESPPHEEGAADNFAP